MSSDERGSKSSSWLMALATVLYVICSWLSLHFTETLRFASDSPGGEPPWYFIRQDAIHGLCFLAYLVLCLGIGLLAIKKRMAGGATLLWFGFVCSAAPVWMLAVIYLRSDHIFDPVKARTSWATFDSYFGDPLAWGWILLLLIATIPHVVSRIRSRNAVRA